MVEDKALQSFDLVIVGGGIAGAALALSLANAPIKIALLEARSRDEFFASMKVGERASQVGDFDTRVSALTEVSQQFLLEIGAWENLTSERVEHYASMHVWDGLGTASIAFDAAEVHASELGVIVENRHLQSAIYEAIEAQENLVCLWGAAPTGFTRHSDEHGTYSELSFESRAPLHCRLLIGADGALSKVRQAYGFETREWDYDHHAIVATVKTAEPHADTAWQRFSEDGPLAFLPLADQEGSGRFCSIVWSIEPLQAKALMAMPDEAFMSALEGAFEGRLGAIEAVSKRQCFPLRQRHVKQYVKHNAVLIADAAHTIHPLAGQGLNLGLKDVALLSKLIKDAAAKEIALSHSLVLQRYHRERQVDNLAMMAAMEGFKRLFGSSDPILRWVRNTGMNWMNQQHLIKKQLIRQAMGLS